MLGALQKETEKLENYVSQFEKLLTFRNSIAKKLSEKYSVFFKKGSVAIVTEPTVIKVNNDKNNYISVDAGVVHVPEINETLLYSGANIYFSPINDDAPLSIYRGIDQLFYKRVAVLVGLTLSEFQNKKVNKNFIKDNNLLLGLGMRLFNMVKLNAGYFFFKQQDANSLKSELHIKQQPFFSISFDFDLKGAFQDFGKLFEQLKLEEVS